MMPKLSELEDQITKLSKENERLIKQQRYHEEKYAKELQWLREELNKAQKGDEKISFAKLSFLADMSHELRTPLNTVIGFCQYLLGDQALNKDQEEKIRLMLASSEDLLGLINDILEMSKIELGDLDLHSADFDLYEILESLSSSYHAKAYLKGLNFETEFAANLPRFLLGDGGKLRYILLTILSNALKESISGKLIFRVWRGEEQIPDTYQLFFEIGNSRPENQPELKPEETTLSASSLGLELSREFARLMQGDLVHKRQKNSSRFLANVQLAIAPTMPEKPDSFLERVARIAEKRDRFRSLEMQLARIPTDIRGELHEALNQYSLSSVERVCQKIAKIDAPLAQDIVGLAKEFDFKTILSLLSK